MNARVCNSKQKWNHDKCRCECKELDDWSSCTDVYMWDLSTCYCKYNKTCKIVIRHVKLMNIKILKIVHAGKGLFGKLVIACEGEILSRTETSFFDKKSNILKNDCLIYTISFIIICLLLLVVLSISCYYYYYVKH